MATTYNLKRAERSRSAILKAAVKCFVSTGATVSVTAICREADVSRATLFSHFGSKEGLYEAVIRELSDRQLEPVLALLGQTDRYAERLREFGRGFALAVLSKESIGARRLATSELRSLPKLAKVHYQLGIGRILPVLTAFLKNGIEAGHVRNADPVLLAEQFLAATLGYRQYRALIDYRETSASNDEYVESAVRSVLLSSEKPKAR